MDNLLQQGLYKYLPNKTLVVGHHLNFLMVDIISNYLLTTLSLCLLEKIENNFKNIKRQYK